MVIVSLRARRSGSFGVIFTALAGVVEHDHMPPSPDWLSHLFELACAARAIARRLASVASQFARKFGLKRIQLARLGDRFRGGEVRQYPILQNLRGLGA